MRKSPECVPKHTSLNIADHLLDRYKLGRFLDLFPAAPEGPVVRDFQPYQGYAGTLMVIGGIGFADERTANHVVVGTKPALGATRGSLR